MTIDSTIDLEGLRNAARIMHEAGRVDPEAAIEGARSINECFPTAEQAAQNLLDVIRMMGEGMSTAPWPDYAGNEIHVGDRIRHPSGEEGVVLYLSDECEPEDQWRVDYGDGALSRLCLQVGDKGRAVRVRGSEPDTRKRLTDAELIAALRKRPYDRAAREAADRIEDLAISRKKGQQAV